MSNLKKQLQQIDITKIKMKNGRTVENELKRHARILADCIMLELNRVYDLYEPKKYKRTYSLYDSFYMDENVRIQVSAAGSSLSIKMGFDDGAIHSGFYGDKVNTAVLLNEGYQTHGSFKNVPYLGFKEPTHFIEKGINRYKQKVNKPFTVKVTINDEVRVF